MTGDAGVDAYPLLLPKGLISAPSGEGRAVRSSTPDDGVTGPRAEGLGRRWWSWAGRRPVWHAGWPLPERWASVLLGLWCVAWVALSLRGGMYSWHYFVTAGTVIADEGPGSGLHLYSAHPELQFGPLSVLLAWLATGAGRAASFPLGAITMLLLGAVVAAAVCGLRSAAGHGVSTLGAKWTVALLAPGWLVLSLHYAHLDDALTLALATLATLAMVRGRTAVAVVLFALATGAKPWALPMGLAAVAAMPTRGHARDRGRVVGAYLLLVALPWVPFLAASPGTLGLGSFRIDVARDSVLTLFTDATLTPSWTRPAQLVAASVCVLWCARKGRLAGVLLVVVATRMVLDPGTYGYYTSGLMVAALVLDSASRRPWRAALVLCWWLTTLVPISSPHALALIRLAVLCALIATTTLIRPAGAGASRGGTFLGAG